MTETKSRLRGSENALRLPRHRASVKFRLARAVSVKQGFYWFLFGARNPTLTDCNKRSKSKLQSYRSPQLISDGVVGKDRMRANEKSNEAEIYILLEIG